MVAQTLAWSSLGAAGTQAANFTGITHNLSAIAVKATLIQTGVVTPAMIGGNNDAASIDSGEVRTDGNYAGPGQPTNSALELDNGGRTGNGASPGGDSHTVDLRLDFDTRNAALYGDGAQNVSFWISDIDRDSWRDQVNVRAYDIYGNQVAVTYANLGSNVAYNAATGDFTAIQANNNLQPTNAAGSVQIIIPGPIAYLVIDYDNLSTGDQRVEISNIRFETIPPDYPWCFVAGTLIATPHGDVPVENLKIGDLVQTRDHGHQPLRWIGRRTVPAIGAFAPIEFAAGTIGNTQPLRLSPSHRVLVSGSAIELLFDMGEALVPASAMVDGHGVRRCEGGDVTYVHMLFDRHELVWSNGALSESFHPGDASLGGIARAQRDELLSLFPELRHEGFSFGPSVRPTINHAEAALLH